MSDWAFSKAQWIVPLIPENVGIARSHVLALERYDLLESVATALREARAQGWREALEASTERIAELIVAQHAIANGEAARVLRHAQDELRALAARGPKEGT